MGRIEEIRQKSEYDFSMRRKGDKVYVNQGGLNVAEISVPEFAEKIEDAFAVSIPFLLSRIQIAEEALRRISIEMPGSHLNELVTHKERIAKHALEQIKS